MVAAAARRIAEAAGRAWALRRPYLAAHLLAALATALALAPLTAAAFRLAASVSGAPAVADMEIARLALSPAGLLGLLAAASVAGAAATVQLGAMLAVDAAARAGASVSALAALQALAPRLPSILALAARLGAALLLRAAPLAALGALAARALIGAHDINYYLTERPPEFLAAVALGGVLGLALVLWCGAYLLRAALALPAVALGGMRSGPALASSARWTAGRRREMLALGAFWAGGAALFGLAASAATGALAAATAPDPAAGLRPAALHALAALTLLGAANTAVAAAAGGTLASLLGGLYAEAGGVARPAPRPALRLRPGLVALLALGVGAAAATGAAEIAEDLRRPDAVAVIGHRGGGLPENTLTAIRQGVAAGADWVEIDVQETADGAVVVVHDSDFMKTAGDPLKVWEATLDDVAALDLGARLGPDYAGEAAPTLAAALDAAKGRAGVLIELKHYGHAVRLEERVAEAVAEAGMEDAVAAMSLDHAAARRMKALRPDWRVGLLAATAVGDLARLEADFLAVGARLATPDLIRRARAAGRDVYVWTVNDAPTMQRMIARGAAGLITDRPALARAVLDARAAMTTAERLALLVADMVGGDAAPATPQ